MSVNNPSKNWMCRDTQGIAKVTDSSLPGNWPYEQSSGNPILYHGEKKARRVKSSFCAIFVVFKSI